MSARPAPLHESGVDGGVDVVVRAEHACFGGVQGFYEMQSAAVGGPMRFGLFRPARTTSRAPLLVCLVGLTCTEDTFAIKAGAQRLASELGLALLTPDTSPRHKRVDGDDASWDFGVAAGFYVDATVPAYAHSRMRTHILDELIPLVGRSVDVDGDRVSITGHSMGGHGALTLALTAPTRFRSVSAFAPICAPTQVPWGKKAFAGYFGDGDVARWRAHDACALVDDGHRFPGPPPLIDQGLADKFLVEQLRPELLEASCARAGQALTLRRHAGFDHGYFFIASVVDDHLRFHADALRG